MDTASHHASLIVRICGRIAVGLGLLVFAPAVFAEEFIELAIPLEDGRSYSPREFCAISNEKLDTHYILDRVPDRRIELTALERAALVLANETGLLRVSITPERLVISVPNHEDDRVRRQQRERLEKLFHVPLTEWPKEKGLHLPDDFAAGRRTILLVHGLEADASDLQRFAEACRESGIQSIFFDYPNDGPIAWSGDRLRTELNELSVRHPKLRLAIVAHSMGGLVARHALEATDRPPSAVTHLFMLGTPNHGSRLAGAQSWLELLENSPLAILLGRELMRDGIGEAADDLLPGSIFLTQLNKNRRPQTVRYFAAIGRRSFLSEEQRASVERELDSLCTRRGIRPEVRLAVRSAIGAEELRDGLSDGAVSVESARLSGVDDTKAFDLNHLELLALPGDRPEEAELFQWIMMILGSENQGTQK